MADHVLPRYPIYIPSKGRADRPITATALHDDGVPFRFVVEPQEQEAYAALFGAEHVVVLPFANRGVVPVRNWIKEHSIAEGYERHWQLDDDISQFWRVYRGKRVRVTAGVGFRVCEDFTDRYENIALSGLNYTMFYYGHGILPPFYLNQRIYSCTLVNNAIPHRWRGRYNDDTDLTLQVLADGWCTVLLNAFLADVAWSTPTTPGGNTGTVYLGDGRLKMARALERMWPGVVTTQRRFQRPQHVVKDNWRRFDTPLQLKPGIDLAALPAVDNYGMKLVQVRPEIKSARLRALLAAAEDDAP